MYGASDAHYHISDAKRCLNHAYTSRQVDEPEITTCLWCGEIIEDGQLCFDCNMKLIDLLSKNLAEAVWK